MAIQDAMVQSIPCAYYTVVSLLLQVYASSFIDVMFVMFASSTLCGYVGSFTWD